MEWIAAAEIERAIAGVSGIRMAAREVTFETECPEPAVVALKTVDDVFIQAGEITGVGHTKADLQPLAARLARLDWAPAALAVAAVRDLPASPRFDVVASLEGRRTYNRFDVENSTGRLLQSRLGGTHLPRTDNARPVDPDLTVRLFLRGSRAVAALRLGPRPLHRRSYKEDAGPGTLHPPVAAMLAMLTNPTAGEAVADPFCGDGTVAIEAALLRTGADISASDIDPARVEHARRNAERAGVEIQCSIADAGDITWDAGSVDVVVTNPPWNVSVSGSGELHQSLDPFWSRLLNAFTAHGRLCVLADADLKVPARIERFGYLVPFRAQIRLAGRISEVVLARPATANRLQLPADLARWRDRARRDGVVTEAGW
ncbi:methyltransferase [Micromonospora sp. NPDC007271]|uniref:methyltransferase n=1 Tax=Micromonospora sp. NPDC007271 TaxID=3154587 RepID=UPI0033D64C11